MVNLNRRIRCVKQKGLGMLNIDTSEIMNKEMNRKQFLRNVGIGLVAFTGLAAALRAVGQLPAASDESQDMPHGAAARSASSYGGSVYGGTKSQS
jgi:hypothetical protein